MARARKKTTAPPYNLDDAAALLIQASANDASDSAHVGAVLADVAADMERSGATGARLLGSAARQLIRSAAAGDVSALETALMEAGMVVEAVMSLAEAPASAPEADSTVAPASPGAGADLRIPADADPELLEGFVAESLEYLQAAQAALLVMEHSPGSVEECNTVFRAFHTIKGTSAFLGLDAITELAHFAESLLSRIRERELRFDRVQAEASLGAVDVLGTLIQTMAKLGPGHVRPLPDSYETVRAALLDAEHMTPAPAPLPATHPVPGALVPAQSDSGELSDAMVQNASRAGDVWMRVRTERVDRLVDLVGELVIAQSMLIQDVTVTTDAQGDLARKVTHAGKIVRELQDLSMTMRMVPLRPTFQKMARLARDVALRTGKPVELVTSGEDTEVDRNMVDLIADPLVHMIRNAIDHGIEDVADRAAAGKPALGSVRLSAYHAAGNVVIELADDGRGLDRRRLVERALGRGLIESDKGMADADVFNLVFAPGFSTAASVTAISGRGVGMDVVRRNVEALRGRIEITSEQGCGTRFTVRLPLTLAITDGMLVQVGVERYIVPTMHIQLSLRPTPEMIATVVGTGEILHLRDELLPIIRLHRLFGVDGAEHDPAQALLVVVGTSTRRFALLVDDLITQQQVVAKPLGNGIGRVPGVSGSAILGDGRVGLILDVAQILDLASARSTDPVRFQAA